MSGVAGQVSNEILERLLSLENPSRDDVNRLKIEVCRKYRSPIVPANSQILKLISESLLPKFGPLLVDKQVRSLSGVTTVAVMPKPYGCPHGKCTYCPGGPDEGVPRAYTGREPAVMRALESGYDPYLQVESRLRQLRGMGHPVDKVELILVGGTFPFMPRSYQEDFVKRCLDALNGEASRSLDEAKVRSENAPIKNVGITIETRPDWSRRGHVDHMLSMGVTRVEIGVQTLYDDVYERIQREIPAPGIADGVMSGNLRQLVQEELARRGIACRCIRCREVGQHAMRNTPSPLTENIRLQRIVYEASGGTEIFLSFEDPKLDILVGYVRLRIPGEEAHRTEIKDQNAAIIRELHVFGQTVPVGGRQE